MNVWQLTTPQIELWNRICGSQMHQLGLLLLYSKPRVDCWLYIWPHCHFPQSTLPFPSPWQFEHARYYLLPLQTGIQAYQKKTNLFSVSKNFITNSGYFGTAGSKNIISSARVALVWRIWHSHIICWFQQLCPEEVIDSTSSWDSCLNQHIKFTP